jgi:putative membrane protein
MSDIGVPELLIIVLIAVMWAIPIILLALGIRWLLARTSSGTHPASPGYDPALGVLRERYARGEIDATEFEERSRTLDV